MSTLPFLLSDTVKKRYSVRTFKKQPVSEELKNTILAYAKTIQNPFGPKIRIQFIDKDTSPNGEKLGTYGVIKNAQTFLGVAVKNEEGAQEGLGYEFEQLVLYITSLGLGTCWLGGTFTKSAFAAAMDIKPDEIFPIISPVGYTADKKSIVEKIMRSHIKADSREPNSRLFFKNDFQTPLPESEFKEYAQALEFVRLAPSAVNKQPWRIVDDGNALHFFECHNLSGENKNFDLQRIDIGIALSHFHLAVAEKGLSGSFQKSKPDITPPENTEYIISWQK